MPRPLGAGFHSRHLWIKLGLLLLFCALVRLPSFRLGLDRDEGEHATLAQQWIAGNGLPYRDYFEQKPPLPAVLDALALRVLGPGQGALRAMDLAWQLAGVLAFFFLMRRLAGEGTALASAAILVLASAGARIQGLAANTESFLLLPTALGLLGLWGAESGARRPWAGWLLAGIGLGFASLAKQTALAGLAFFPLFFCASTAGFGRRLVLLASGACLPWLAALAYFGAHGAAQDFLFCTWSYNFHYAGQGISGFASRLAGSLVHLAPEQAGLWLAAGLGAWMALGSRGLAGRLLGAWLAAALAGAAVSGRFYPHYFIPLAAPLAGLAGLSLHLLRPASPAWARHVLAAGLAWLALGFCAFSLPLWASADGAEMSRRTYGVESMAQAPAAAALLNKLDPQGRRLWIWGSEAELYFLSGRKPATRFLFNYPFTGEAPEYPGGRDEMLKSLDDPAVTSAVMSSPLDTADPFQAALAAKLGHGFKLAAQGPGYFLAVRR